ncbi:MAG: 3-oxoacyl-[acyl-carrier-protein] synthase, partial [Verrucomicrobiota bacterium]
MTKRRRIAITGIGMVTPVGNDTATTWANLRAGRSGAGQIQRFDARGFSTRIGAEVKNFNPDVIDDRKLLKFASRPHRFALAAAEEALADAG